MTTNVPYFGELLAVVGDCKEGAKIEAALDRIVDQFIADLEARRVIEHPFLVSTPLIRLQQKTIAWNRITGWIAADLWGKAFGGFSALPRTLLSSTVLENDYLRLETWAIAQTLRRVGVRFRRGKFVLLAHPRETIPPCAREMGCLCAGHARGNAATAECDTTE